MLHAMSQAGIAQDHVTGSHGKVAVSGGFSRFFGAPC